ncbi:MAG: MBOAT family protein [Fuerstiella sp.]|nr:MBOAT family protein [Fuerstiella sp.]
MHFTSFTYLAFLPLVLLAYRLMPTYGLQNVLLLVASYVFYGWWDYRFCLLMLVSSLVDYTTGAMLHRQKNLRSRKCLLAFSIACNLGLLGVFKYLNFFTESFRELGQLFGMNMSGGTIEIILPVGISFYTFQTMSYTLDIYRRRLKPADNLIDYLAFVSFFPQLVAGPIERASHLLPQLRKARSVSREESAGGVRQILCGFFKKIVIADSVAVFVTAAYVSPADATGPELVLATLLFAFQIYCDFSAYSDIAIGTARLFGIHLMQNFAYPYFSRSMREFWQRWHISLSTWFRDYVYIPLGGNQGSGLIRNRNLLLTFLISGLWHGAAWRFLGWGALHGTALITENSANIGTLHGKRLQEHLLPSLSGLVRMLLTFCVVCLSWVLFRAETISDALMIWKKMVFSITTLTHWNPLWIEYSSRGPLFYTLNMLLVFVLVEWAHRHHPFPLEIGHWPTPLRWPAYTLVLWLIVEHADKTPQSPFIYFQF